MDTNQNTINPEEKSLISEAAICEKQMIKSDQELMKKIDELDEALDDIAIARQALNNKKDTINQQIKTLKQDKAKQQRILSRLKFINTFTICLINIFVILLVCNIFKYEYLNFEEDKSLLDSDYTKQINDLEESINNLTQQRNELQSRLVQREQNIRLSSKKAHIASHNEHPDTINTILEEDNYNEIDSYISSLKRYPSKRVIQKEIDGISYYEVAQKYNLEEYLLNDSGNSSIYPGAIIRGDSLMQGISNYALIPQKRTPIILVYNNDGRSIQVENVSYGGVKEAINQLWNESTREYSEKWEYSVRSLQNEESLELSLGIGYGSASFDFGINQTQTTSTMAVTFTETYYSVSVEPLNRPSQYFQIGCDIKSLGDYEPAYISSVDYGRRILILVTSELSEEEIKAKLGAGINGVDISADIGYIKKEIDSNCKIYCYGGNSAKTLQTIDTDKKSGGLKGWWNELINGKSDDINAANQIVTVDDSLINPVPLAYHLNYLSDNSSVPAVAIINDNIILAETARLVTITLEGNLPGVFHFSDSVNAIGYVVNTDQIHITKKGETSGEIQFIWDASTSDSLTGFFNNSSFSCSLAELDENKDYCYTLDEKKHMFSKKASTNIHIFISNAIYEIP